MAVHREFVVVGAGPAGSVAAIVLARAGRKVLVVEQADFPRAKVCGACVSSVGVEVLGQLGVLPRLHAAGARELTRMKIEPPRRRPVRVALPSPMLGVSRAILDTVLRDAALAAGAEIWQPARCEQVTEEQERIRIVVRRRGQSPKEIEAERAIIADGKSRNEYDRTHGKLGIRAAVRGQLDDRDSIRLFPGDGFYVGLAAVECGLSNLAAAITKRAFAEGGSNTPDVIDWMRRRHRALDNALAETNLSEFGACPLPRHRTTVRKPRFAHIGNAARAFEPIGGEGMGLAMIDAARTARRWVAGETPQRHRPYSHSLIASACDLIGRAAGSPPMTALVYGLMQIRPLADLTLAGIKRHSARTGPGF